MIFLKQNEAAADSVTQGFNKINSNSIYCMMQYMLFFYRRMNMIIDRELLMQRRFTFVEGWPDVPMPLILHRIKKFHLIFT